MSQWYTVNCGNCGCEIHVHEDWDEEPEYCKDCAWISEICEICGEELRIHRSWDNPPTAHKECREQEHAKWHEKRCAHCGDIIKYHEDWENVSDYCKNCKWYEETCAICGGSIRISREWDNPPKVHKECREQERAKWLTKSCDHCGKEIRYNREWKNVPNFCEECLWYEIECFICHRNLRVCREWENPPKAHKDCLNQFKSRKETCRECGGTFIISTGLQIKCHENGWDLPTRCPQCKQDSILISGALAAARERFGFPVKAIIKPGGMNSEKEIIIFNKKTGEEVGNIDMKDRGIIIERREAVTKDLNGNVFAKTRKGQEGFIQSKRVADTYDNSDINKIQRTRDTTEGILITKRIRESENLESGKKVKIRPGTEGGNVIQKTDK